MATTVSWHNWSVCTLTNAMWLRHLPLVCRRIHAHGNLTNDLTNDLAEAAERSGAPSEVMSEVMSEITMCVDPSTHEWEVTWSHCVCQSTYWPIGSSHQKGWRFHSSTYQSFEETVKMDVFGVLSVKMSLFYTPRGVCTVFSELREPLERTLLIGRTAKPLRSKLSALSHVT